MNRMQMAEHLANEAGKLNKEDLCIFIIVADSDGEQQSFITNAAVNAPIAFARAISTLNNPVSYTDDNFEEKIIKVEIN